MTALRPAVFLDRDGTVIDEREYLDDPARVELLPGSAQAIAALHEAGYAIVLVTNQSGIARGYYTDSQYRAVAARVLEVLGSQGAMVDATYYCPHHPDVTGPCECRKPGTGMYRDAAAALALDPARSFYVGDKLTDVLPARELGGRGLLVRTGYGREAEPHAPPDVTVVDDLGAAAAHILGR